MPMTMSYAQPVDSRVYERPFCEVNGNATEIRCFKDFMEWCCESYWDFFFPPMNQRYDYLRLPYDVELQNYTFKKRPTRAFACLPTKSYPRRNCLSYDHPNQENLIKGMQWLQTV
eukprot:CAMPEP_0116540868 /NCGR_PEP_ID=MMETSP0397-20121206/178_1 /TAXON_ID=216820 /ORGANISM="Cyclophora tenuis, Strain ECT3854" /LENGTH=114 /DNA_ID=CAMNT_0004064771 /DNA_START=28 /DNA_END=372 /DNA_ORIENTATION=-